MKLAYVTGATGCVGRNLVNELLTDNWKIIVLHRKSSNLSRLKEVDVHFQEVDLHNLESVRKSILENADAIFHVAGNTSHWSAEADEQWKDNVLATRNLVQVALEKKVKRFIFTSTGATQDYQGTDQEFAKKINPPYVRTKRQSELEVYEGIEKGLDAVILQPIIVIGAYDYNSYSQIFSTIAKSPLQLAFPGRIAFCHARDIAKAHVQAFYKGRCCEHYMLGGTHASWKIVFQKIAAVMGADVTVKVAPIWLLKIASYFFMLVSFFNKKKPLLTPELVSLLKDAPDIPYCEKRKAYLDLNYESASLDSMISDCYLWLVSEGLLK